MHPHNIARPLLAAVLETLWGVAATSLTWSAADNAPVRNHMWAVGLTPFGHLGVSDQLSFVQKDVALRNMVNAHINATMASTKFLLERFQRFGHGEAPLSRKARGEGRYCMRAGKMTVRATRCHGEFYGNRNDHSLPEDGRPFSAAFSTSPMHSYPCWD